MVKDQNVDDVRGRCRWIQCGYLCPHCGSESLAVERQSLVRTDEPPPNDHFCVFEYICMNCGKGSFDAPVEMIGLGPRVIVSEYR